MNPLEFDSRIPSTDPEAEGKKEEQKPLFTAPAVLPPPVPTAFAESTRAQIPTLPAQGEVEEEPLIGFTPVEDDEPLEGFTPIGTTSTISSGENVEALPVPLQEYMAPEYKADYNDPSWTESLSGGVSNWVQNIANVSQGLSEQQLALSRKLQDHATYNYNRANGNALLDTFFSVFGITQDMEAGVREELAVLLDYYSLYAQDIADYFYTEPTDAPMLSVDGVTDLIFRNAPQMVFGAIATSLSGGLGSAVFMSQGAGEALGLMKEYERETGETIDPQKKIAVSLGVGITWKYLEGMGINAVLNTATGSMTMQSLKKIGVATLTEGLTEGAQEATQIGGQLFYNDKYTVAENALERIGSAVLGGALLGGIMSTAAGGVNAAVTPKDRYAMELTDFEKVGDFDSPRFTVTQPGHALEGQVISLQQAEESGLSMPAYRVQLLRRQLKNSSSITDKGAGAIIKLLNMMGMSAGMDTEQFLSALSLKVTNRQNIEPTDLTQFIASDNAILTRKDYAQLVQAQNMVRNAKQLGLSTADAKLMAQTATGWILQKNGKWKKLVKPIRPKFEAMLTALQKGQTIINKSTVHAVTLGNLLNKNDKIFSYYPALKNVNVRFVNKPNAPWGGLWDGTNGEIQINLHAFGATDAKSFQLAYAGKITKASADFKYLYGKVGGILAHEVQHAIASREKAALEQGGTNIVGKGSYMFDGPLDPLFEKEFPGVSQEYRYTKLAGNQARQAEIEADFRSWLQRNYKGSIEDYAHHFYTRLRGEVDARIADQLFRAEFFGQMESMGITIEQQMAAKMLKDFAHSEMKDTVKVSNTVWRTPDQLSAAEKSMMEVANGDIKGAVAIAELGDIVIKMFEGANFYTAAHELVHVFRATLPAKKQRQLADLYGVPTRFVGKRLLWEPAIEERFAQDFLAYLKLLPERLKKEKDVTGKRYINFFKDFSTMLEDSVLETMGSQDAAEKQFQKLDDSTLRVFDKIFEKEYGNMSYLQQPVKNGKLWAKLYKHLSIGKYTEIIGIPQTGRAIRDMFNYWNSSISEGQDLIEKVSILLEGDNKRLAEAFVAAEDGDFVEGLVSRRRQAQRGEVTAEQEGELDNPQDVKPFAGSTYQERLFHGTTSDFDEFDTSKAGANTQAGDTKLGVFVSNDPYMSLGFGHKLKSVFIDAKKPVDFSAINELGEYTVEQFIDLVYIITGVRVDGSDYTSVQDMIIDPDFMEPYVDLMPDSSVSDTTISVGELMENMVSALDDPETYWPDFKKMLIKEDGTFTQATERLRALGYDAIVIPAHTQDAVLSHATKVSYKSAGLPDPEGFDANAPSKEYIVFSPSQIRTIHTDVHPITDPLNPEYDPAAPLAPVERTYPAKKQTISPNEIVSAQEQVRQQNFEDAVLLFRDYFDSAQAQLLRAGAFNTGFVERLVADIKYKIAQYGDSPTDKEVKELEALVQDLERAKTTRFIHISLEGLLDTLRENNKSAFKRALTILTAKERKTVRFADFLEGPDAIASIDDINVADIIRHYANRKGRDLAILNIKNTGELEGSIVEYNGVETEKDFVAPMSIPFLDGKQMHPFVMQAYKQLLEPLETSNILMTYLRHSKMGQFFNPILMPLYNTVQMLQVGVGFFVDPKGTRTAIVEGYKDFMERRERYVLYEKYGLSSQPDVIIKSQQERMYARALFTGRWRQKGFVAAIGGTMQEYFDYVKKGTSQSRVRRREPGTTVATKALNGLSTVIEQGGRSVIGVYNILSDMSWAGDSISRQVTARYLQDVKGMTTQQAALEASRATGMYSDVPRATRRVLNLIFFTPTFKIAMGNFFTSSLNSMALILNKDTKNMYHKEKAMVVVRTLGIFFAFDFLMTAVLGFEREELGRRYFRRVSTQDTDQRFARGEKELVLTWSSPHNLFSKYVNKMNTVLFDQGTINRPQTFMSQFGYEFHPAFTIMGNVVANKRSVSGEPIYGVFDSPLEQSLKISGYILGNTYALFRTVIDQDLDPRGRELVVENYSKAVDYTLGLIGFAYERDPFEERKIAQLNGLINAWKKEIGASGLLDRIVSGEITKQELDDMIKKSDPKTKVFLNRIDALLTDLNEYYYPMEPGFYETPDMEELKRQMGGFDVDRQLPLEAGMGEMGVDDEPLEGFTPVEEMPL